MPPVPRNFWEKIYFSNPDLYFDNLQQLYQVVRCIAMMDHSFRNEKKIVAICWCTETNTFSGHYLPGDVSFRTVFSPASFSLSLIDRSDTELASTSVAKSKQTDIMVWLEAHAGALGLDSAAFSTDLPYEMPDLYIRNRKPFLPDEETQMKFLSLYNNAYKVLESVTEEISGFEKIRLYPRHINLETSHIIKDTGDMETSACVRIGMSPGDLVRPEPYFYVNVLPFPSTENFPALPVGEWYEDEWVGAVYTLSQINSLPSETAQEASVREFMKAAYPILRNTIR